MRRRCPREGTRVRFAANPVARAMYSGSRYPYYVPATGEAGTVTSIPTGRGRATCMPGPAGGMVYVDWDRGGTAGVFRAHLQRESGAQLRGAGRARRRRRRR